MNNEKDKNLTRFLLTFFLGWIGSIIINATDLKPKGYKSRTLAYFFLTYVTFGIYGLVAAISNLSFDPAKETNIGYAKEYGYVYSTNEETDSINTILDEQNKQPKTLEINMLIKKAIVLLMAIFSLVMLSFSLCEDKLFYSLPENGFTFMTFMSYLITSSFNWAIYLIGVFCILFLLISLILIALSVFNFFLKKSFNFNLIVIIVSIVTAVLYTLIGIIFVIVCTATYGRMHFSTSAYIPLIIQLVLISAYIVFDKIKTLGTIGANDNKQPTTASTVLNKVDAEAELIKKYKNLCEQGIITEEEFNEKRRQILHL